MMSRTPMLPAAMLVGALAMVAAYGWAQTPDAPTPPEPVTPAAPTTPAVPATPEAPTPAAPEVPPAPAAPAPAAPAPAAPAAPAAPPAVTYAADALLIVAHPSRAGEAMDADWLKAVYLGKRNRWSDGSPIKPIRRKPASPAGEALLERVLDMSASKFRRYWQKRQLSGRGVMPPVAASGRGLTGLVGNNPAMLTVVTGAELGTAGGVHVVEVK